MPAGVPYRMVPSVPQVPPKNDPSSAPISCGGVPAAATFFNRPPATKPIELLSGDQKGCDALSVPASFRNVTALTGRTYNAADSWPGRATMAMVVPSGETAMSAAERPTAGTRNRSSSGSAGPCR